MSPRAWVVSTLLAAAAACGPQPAPAPSPGGYRLSLSPDGQLISVHAAGVPRSTILNDLATKYQIGVRAYDVPDGPVTVSRENVPVLVGVAALFPAGSRFAIRPGNRELDEPSLDRGPKKGERVKSEVGRYPKGKAPAPKRTQVKGRPSDKLIAPKVDVPGYKPEAKRVMAPPLGRGAKLTRGTVQPDSSLQLTFSITAAGQVTLIGRQRVEGTPPASAMVEGPFLVVLRDASRRIAFAQALVDPLEQHSYLPDGTHDQGRAATGTFSVLLPPALAAQATLTGLTLEFVDGRALTLPVRLDPQTLDRSLRDAKPMTTLPGQALFEPANQPR